MYTKLQIQDFFKQLKTDAKLPRKGRKLLICYPGYVVTVTKVDKDQFTVSTEEFKNPTSNPTR